uniref:JmjC domain-containing protein n=1 Tax=Leptocylindrus danicus TaxID=163516 RepID=A0A7S2PP47_9STRA|mmetsp:Transcript_6664/g.9859  ORF Transcript_6664/g.9859 Transcript_6664/m.9859 type:complete len:286 (+) Transcript_6664:123-980(+)
MRPLDRRKLDICNEVHNIITDQGTNVQNLAEFLLENRDFCLNFFLFEDLEKEYHDVGEKEFVRVDGDELRYAAFVHDFMEVNKPVMITNLTKEWNARKHWTKTKTLRGHKKIVPNLNYLKLKFGKCEVEVYRQDQPGFSSVKSRKSAMSVEDYVDDYWEQNNLEEADSSSSSSLELNYLKDWKFVVQNPRYDAYTCPEFFRDDWLNFSMKSAYKFVYLGPKGTITGLHADVLSSYSWSANVTGRKRWYLIPPHFTLCLYDIFGTRIAPHLHYDCDHLYPGLAIAR